ncbi:ATP synthase F1 subunit delta [Ascidiimonas aurantiaca]|uniref:ATP synthase F1 subunit delta n=1 Tax=Ascidiimonas aurantiaca TaxID=1685432 RepID=UPI0030EF45E8
MAGTRAAIRYAKAVLSLALEQGKADIIHANMKHVLQTIAKEKELQDFLQSPVIKSEVKKSALKEVFAEADAATIRLIDVLIDNKRVALLYEVAGKYITLHNEHKGVQSAVVTTAVPLTDDLKNKVLGKVKELTGKEVNLESKIDESIIGGFILRVGDLQYDTSIAGKLSDLKRTFTSN